MMFNSPKDFKRGRLINNQYRIIDLIVAITGIFTSILLCLLYLLALDGKNLVIFLLLLLPAVVAVAALTNYGVYHNLIVYWQLFLVYINCRKNYKWEGIYKYEKEEND